jgi:ubiquinone/menaquinone biosynthesis C-methylase UbiE
MTGLDISGNFLRFASSEQSAAREEIKYVQGDAEALPFSGSSFDFIASFMSLMGVPRPIRTIREAIRVLRPGGFLQFSISHPCFSTPRWEWTREQRPALLCGDYFRRVKEIKSWTFKAWKDRKGSEEVVTFRAPTFRRTLSDWVNELISNGFILEHMVEPHPSNRDVKKCPLVSDARTIAFFLIIRCRKP